MLVSDNDFALAFCTTSVSVSKIARYYLRALERTAQNLPNPEFVPNSESAINLEHIMPQSPNEDWVITEQDIDSYCNRLGNLALLQADRNNKIGNLKFEDKKYIYKKSSFLLTTQIADLDKWGIEEIEIRQKKLAEFAVKTWSL